MSKRTRAAVEFMQKAAKPAHHAKAASAAPVDEHAAKKAKTGISAVDPAELAVAMKQAYPKGFKATASLTPFERRVYAITRRIPAGKVSTYKYVAESLGHPRAYRAVGNALRHNPFAPIVPCHRVLPSSGRIGGFSGSTTVDGALVRRKLHLLHEEGVQFQGNELRRDADYRRAVIITHIDDKGLDRDTSDQALQAH